MADLSVVPDGATAGVRRKSMDPVSEFIRLQELPNPGNRFSIEDLIGIGTSANVYSALDQQKGEKVAVKIITNIAENIMEIESEYRAMCSVGGQSILPAFHGAYMNTAKDGRKELWFVMELCEGITVSSLLKWLDKQNKSLTEEEISALLKSMLIGIHHMHEKDIIHRDIRAANFILSESGELKLFDFGTCAVLKGDNLKAHSAIGAPHWMAPEVIVCEQLTAYTKSCDIWSLGITAMEIAQKKPPLHDVHAVRALFLIARNPPTTLHKSEEYSDVFKDFIDECLVKNPDHRPCAAELLIHPFITQLDDSKAEASSQELLSNPVPSPVSLKGQKILKGIGQLVLECSSDFEKLEQPYMTFKNCHFKTGSDSPFIRALPDDVACIDQITEDNVLDLLYQRHQRSDVFTFIGDILVFIRPKKSLPLFGPEVAAQYCEKARSDNAPNIFAVADRAYQQMLHHKKPQVVITVGETKSSLTTEVVKHLAFLGPIIKDREGPQHMFEITHTLKKSFDIVEKVGCICSLLDDFGNVTLSTNAEVCRYMKTITVTFSKTGKVSGAIVNAELTESFRFTTKLMRDYNFHVFYHLYHGLKLEKKLSDFGLENLQSFRYLPRKEAQKKDENSYKKLVKTMQTFNLKEKEVSSIFQILSAILLLGDVEYKVRGKTIEPVNPKIFEAAAKNLGVNKLKLQALFTKGKDVKDAQQLIDTFAILVYEKLFKWIVSALNRSLSFSRLVLGDPYSVNVVDLPDHQDPSEEGYLALTTNILNDLLKISIQKLIFVSELQEYHQENLDVPFKYEECSIQSQGLNDHESKLTKLLDILQSSISEKSNRWTKQLENSVKSTCMEVEKNYVKVNHVSKKVQYRKDDILPKTEMLNLNDINAVLKSSTCPLISCLLDELEKEKSYDVKCLLPKLDEESDFPHVVVCINPEDTSNTNSSFVKEKVLQQIQSYHLVETAIIRKQGYARRLPFLDFLNRYKYLAFDFDENVDVTADNCRLLLIRLKMDGWIIGSKKVFLKYYAEEYLSRLYETHVKKIVKVQAMARRFIVKVRQSKKA